MGLSLKSERDLRRSSQLWSNAVTNQVCTASSALSYLFPVYPRVPSCFHRCISKEYHPEVRFHKQTCKRWRLPPTEPGRDETIFNSSLNADYQLESLNFPLILRWNWKDSGRICFVHFYHLHAQQVARKACRVTTSHSLCFFCIWSYTLLPSFPLPVHCGSDRRRTGRDPLVLVSLKTLSKS